jgi:hypothetical protein
MLQNGRVRKRGRDRKRQRDRTCIHIEKRGAEKGRDREIQEKRERERERERKANTRQRLSEKVNATGRNIKKYTKRMDGRRRSREGEENQK